MSVLAAVVAVLVLVAVATAAGVVMRHHGGRARAVNDEAPVVDAAVLGGAVLGDRATLVQFSTEFCTRCPQVRRKLAALADGRVGVAYADVDLTRDPTLARRFHVLQTPTVLIVDGAGIVHGRIGGVPQPGVVERELDALSSEAAHV